MSDFKELNDVTLGQLKRMYIMSECKRIQYCRSLRTFGCFSIFMLATTLSILWAATHISISFNYNWSWN